MLVFNQVIAPGASVIGKFMITFFNSSRIYIDTNLEPLIASILAQNSSVYCPQITEKSIFMLEWRWHQLHLSSFKAELKKNDRWDQQEWSMWLGLTQHRKNV